MCEILHKKQIPSNKTLITDTLLDLLQLSHQVSRSTDNVLGSYLSTWAWSAVITDVTGRRHLTCGEQVHVQIQEVRSRNRRSSLTLWPPDARDPSLQQMVEINMVSQSVWTFNSTTHVWWRYVTVSSYKNVSWTSCVKKHMTHIWILSHAVFTHVHVLTLCFTDLVIFYLFISRRACLQIFLHVSFVSQIVQKHTACSFIFLFSFFPCDFIFTFNFPHGFIFTY